MLCSSIWFHNLEYGVETLNKRQVRLKSVNLQQWCNDFTSTDRYKQVVQHQKRDTRILFSFLS